MDVFDERCFGRYIERDFRRDVWCVLGFPIDNSDLVAVEQALHFFVTADRQCVLSTVNLNFVDCAERDPAFREAVAASDIAVIDGFPVLWVSRFLRLPIRQRTSGSVLVRYILQERGDRGYTLYWLGSDNGVARKAFENCNRMPSKNRAVGHFFPGYGSVEDMSRDEIVQDINRARPDVLLLAMSARKGVIWIERNRKRLRVRVLTHVGAVVDFVAGEERESPRLARKLGIEWAWKTIQSPALAARYWREGKTFLRVLVRHVIPWRVMLARRRGLLQCQEPPHVEMTVAREALISVSGVCAAPHMGRLSECLEQAVLSGNDIVLDVGDVPFVDNRFLGLLLVAWKYQRAQGRRLEIRNAGRVVRRCFRHNLVSRLLGVAENGPDSLPPAGS